MATVTRFHVHVTNAPALDRHYFQHEPEALALAHEQVGPNQDQVTVTAHTKDVETFAVRHVVWEAGAVRDSGWSRWLRGEFIGNSGATDLSFAQSVEV